MELTSNFHHMILADAHVHLHPCFNTSHVWDAARDNFQTIANQVQYQGNYVGVLFLTEIRSEQRFQALYDTANKPSSDPQPDHPPESWRIYQTHEPCSLLIKHADTTTLVVLAGRQIVTQENLEVLALITDQEFEDGHPLPDTIATIYKAGGLPVLPWGVGKWIGRRGTLLKQVIESDLGATICLGDNSGRPVFWPRPPYFKTAEQKGLRILPGTDPLPLVSESNRPGQFGFLIEDSLDLMRPGESMKTLLLNANTSIQPYGQLEKPIRFLLNQLSLRYQKTA